MHRFATEHQLEPCPALARLPGAQERQISIDGVSWKYWFAGSGPALLLVHGFMGYSFSWRFIMPELARHFSVYAVDLPGCGFSERGDALTGSLASDAEGLLQFMDALEIPDAYVLGSSRGGGLAMVLAAKTVERGQRQRIRKLVLVSPINPWSRHGKRLTRILSSAIGEIYVLHVQPRLPFVLELFFNNLFGDARRIPADGLEGYRAGMEVPGTFEHLLRVVRSWRNDLQLIEESLPKLGDIPTLLVWGSKDRAVYPESAPELKRRLPHSDLVIMDRVGHLPYDEVPEEFSRVVCDFLLRDKVAVPVESDAVTVQRR